MHLVSQYEEEPIKVLSSETQNSVFEQEAAIQTLWLEISDFFSTEPLVMRRYVTAVYESSGFRFISVKM